MAVGQLIQASGWEVSDMGKGECSLQMEACMRDNGILVTPMVEVSL